MGLGLSSFWQALNEYFDKKRGRATGIALSICGFGPILMPQLTIFLMSVYGIQGTMLILGAITSHTLAAALLLQPVKWHMKVAMVETQEVEVEKKPSASTEGRYLIQEEVVGHSTRLFYRRFASESSFRRAQSGLFHY